MLVGILPVFRDPHTGFGSLLVRVLVFARMQIHSQTHRVLSEDEAVVAVVGTGAVVGVRDGPFCRLAWEWSDDPCSFCTGHSFGQIHQDQISHDVFSFGLYLF